MISDSAQRFSAHGHYVAPRLVPVHDDQVTGVARAPLISADDHDLPADHEQHLVALHPAAED